MIPVPRSRSLLILSGFPRATVSSRIHFIYRVEGALSTEHHRDFHVATASFVFIGLSSAIFEYKMGTEHRRKPSNEAGNSEHEYGTESDFTMVDAETDDGMGPEELPDKSLDFDEPGPVRTRPRGDEYDVDFS